MHTFRSKCRSEGEIRKNLIFSFLSIGKLGTGKWLIEWKLGFLYITGLNERRIRWLTPCIELSLFLRYPASIYVS